MKALLTIALLALSSSALAEEPAAQTIPPLPQSCSMTAFGETCLHAFGGATTRIPVSGNEKCRGMVAMLYQLSSRLSAPVGKPVTLSEEDCGSVTTFLPAVKETTTFRISFDVPGKDHQAPKDMLVQVYPSNMLESLKEWSEKNHLVVNDSEAKLTPLLDKEHIEYSPRPLATDTERTKQVCVWIRKPEAKAEEEPPFNCDSMLVLHEKAETLPVIRTKKEPGRARTDVYMPFANLIATHPLIQKTFLDLIQLQL